ncbi:MAG TPA: ribosome assembly RNA-binding protein YhbY [Gemmatimonadaceae bacterium]|nr:ribosome assembly RNA-binding protein YhbY [Gemmatimonadaceae bacterium]
MSLTGREKAELRAEAHHLPAVVHVGKEGLSPALVQSLDDALRTRELVKVQLGRSVDEKAKALAGKIAERVGAEIIQVIGKTITLYRHNPELKRKAGDPPPWRK